MEDEYYRVCRQCMKTSRAKAQFCSHCGQPLPKEVEIFLSYAREDQKLLNELLKHLAILKRTGMAILWQDQDISAGTVWRKTLDKHMDTADIILLLISSDFIASDFCYSIEMQRAMKRHARHEACVIPVILRATDWHDAPFTILQALPKNAKPVVSWSNKDEAFLSVAKGIQGVIKERFLP